MNASSASGLWPIFTVRMGIRPLVGGEPPTELAGGDRGRLVEWIAPAGLRHLDRVEGDAAGADSADALHGLLDREMVASRMVQDVERLAIADDLADVLIEPGPVQLDAVEQDQLRRRDLGELAPVALVDPALVVGDSEEIVAELLVRGDELCRLLDAVREGGVGVQVAAEPGHQVRGSEPRAAALEPDRPR